MSVGLEVSSRGLADSTVAMPLSTSQIPVRMLGTEKAMFDARSNGASKGRRACELDLIDQALEAKREDEVIENLVVETMHS